ncbi:HNH endonuclease, partial [Xanthomonas axonopodis pv. begoniae]|nr:HNH endonuclease [Xanthomonas axonopodis pv. begoniae]
VDQTIPSKSEAIAMPSKLTIEHVMPQAWLTHWPLPEQDQVDELTKQKAMVRRSVMLNTLGNLTLITGKFNSSLQNAAWANKRPELLKYSKMNLTRYFHGKEADDWHEAAIRTRTEHLFAQLLRIWPAAGKTANS